MELKAAYAHGQKTLAAQLSALDAKQAKLAGEEGLVKKLLTSLGGAPQRRGYTTRRQADEPTFTVRDAHGQRPTRTVVGWAALAELFGVAEHSCRVYISNGRGSVTRKIDGVSCVVTRVA